MCLLLAIISSVLISFFMRWSENYVRRPLAMLAVNYLSCFGLAVLFTGPHRLLPAHPQLPTAVGLGAAQGILYLAGFLMLQWNMGKNGVVLSSVFMKLGLLVPLMISMIFFGESPGLAQIAGFLAALGGIVLMNQGKEKGKTAGIGLILLLICGGLSDAMSKIYEELGPAPLSPQFLVFTFFFAFLLCGGMMFFRGQRPGKMEWFFGLAVGVPNFFSARFLLLALEGMEGVIVYPVFSVGTLLAVTLLGVVFFGERLKRRQWIAVGLILAALGLLNVRLG